MLTLISIQLSYFINDFFYLNLIIEAGNTALLIVNILCGNVDIND